MEESVPLGRELSYYSGERMPEKAPLPADSDVFGTVYSVTALEAATYDRPIVDLPSRCARGMELGQEVLTPAFQDGGWPTHKRLQHPGAESAAMDLDELREALNAYLANPSLDRGERGRFVLHDPSYVDAGARR